jgi:hypothetical protein
MAGRLSVVSVIGAVLAAVAAGSLMGFGGPLAHVLPALLLLVALVMRRYPGEPALLALMARARGKRRRAPIAVAPPRSRPRVAVPRGGCLIASSLAVRPPPAPVALSFS